MSGQVSRGSAGEYQEDEHAGVARLIGAAHNLLRGGLGGVMASSHVGGLSGAFIPVSEDAGMIDAARSGDLSVEKLETNTPPRGPGPS